MTIKRFSRKMVRAAVACGSGGILLATSCSASDIRTVVSGIEAAAQLLGRDSNPDLNFGQWLISEIND